ncbi:unnamed protein product [Mytilus coruscus]|uniref:C1q domain-containing protein n=1 Tax=Mytilus coruscus TaxID=42192 RepID=A0A6J8D449_MYTCO|nr:unnamed protein product [Mytilus coruscus]
MYNGLLLDNIQTEGDTSVTDQKYVQLFTLIVDEMTRRFELETLINELQHNVSVLKQDDQTLKASWKIPLSKLINKTVEMKYSVNKLKEDHISLNASHIRVKLSQKKTSESLQNMSSIENQLYIVKQKFDRLTHITEIIKERNYNFSIVRQAIGKEHDELIFLCTNLTKERNNTSAERRQSTDDSDIKALQDDMKMTQTQLSTMITETDSSRKTYQIQTKNILNELPGLERSYNGISTRLKQAGENQDVAFVTLMEKVANINKKVAVTSCADPRKTAGIVTFPFIKSSVGITDLNRFRYSGIFHCESPGLYIISVYIVSSTKHASYRVYKNSHLLTDVHMTGNSNDAFDYGTGTALQAVDLKIDDTLSVELGNNVAIEGASLSCITIIKTV